MKILAFGDLHLGAGDKLGPTPGDRLRDQELLLERVVEIAIEENVDAVLLAGDVFDRPRPSPQELLAFVRPMLRLRDRPIDILAINGNAGHDIEAGDRPAALELFTHFMDVHRTPSVWRGPGVTVATLPSVPTARLRAQLGGGDVDEMNLRAAEYLIETARGLREQIDGPAVLLGHWSVEGAVTPTGIDVGIFREPILPLRELEALGFDACLFSHIHKPQLLSPGPLNVDGNGSHHASGRPILYTGSPWVLNFGEAEVAHGVWILDLCAPEPNAVEARFVPVEDRPFVKVGVDLTSEEPFPGSLEERDETDTVAAAIAEHLPLTDAVVRVRYRATEEQIRRVDVAAIRGFCADAHISKLFLEPDIVRAERARVSGLDETVTEMQALELYLVHNEVADPLAGRMREQTAELLEEVAGAGGRLRGGGYRPTRITATNYATFATLDWEIPLGCTVISGQNGAGKSHLVNALDVAPFAARGELAELVSNGEDELELCVEFECGEDQYRVRRAFSARGRGASKLDFEKWTWETHSASWQPLTRENQQETQSLIEATLGFDREILLASAFLRQNDAGRFATATAAEQKDTIFRFLGLHAWEQMREAVRSRVRAGENEQTAITARLETAEQEIAEKAHVERELDLLATREESAVALLTEAEGIRDETAKDLMAAREKASAIDAARKLAAEREKVVSDLQEREQTHRRSLAIETALREELAAQEALAAKVATLEQQLEVSNRAEAIGVEYARLVGEKERIEREIRELGEKHDRAKELLDELQHRPDGARCDRCEQALGAEAREAALASYRSEIEDYATKMQAKAADLDGNLKVALAKAGEQLREIDGTPTAEAVKTQLAQARSAVTRVTEIHGRLERLDEIRAEVDQLGDSLKAATTERDTAAEEYRALEAALDTPIAELETAVAQAEGSVRALRAELEGIRTQAAQWNTRLERIAAAEKTRDELRAKAEAIAEALTTFAACERAYGRNGIPTLVLENVAIPVMEAATNRFLERLGGKTAGARVELRTQREKKDGGGLTETFDIVVLTSEGYERRFARWSGGEQLRIAVALRLGLMEAAGIEVGVFVLDEPAALDEQGKADLVELLRAVHELGVDRILVISHEPELRDAFDQVVVVEQIDDGRSRLVTGAEELVAA